MTNLVISFVDTYDLLNGLIQGKTKGTKDFEYILEILVKSFLCDVPAEIRYQNLEWLRCLFHDNYLDDAIFNEVSTRLYHSVTQTVLTHLPHYKSYLTNHQFDHEDVVRINQSDFILNIDPIKIEYLVRGY